MVTTASIQSHLYLTAQLLGRSQRLTKEVIFAVCRGETASLATSIIQEHVTVYFDLGVASEIANFPTLIDSYFVSAPINTDAPICNSIVKTYYASSNYTTAFVASAPYLFPTDDFYTATTPTKIPTTEEKF